MPKYKFSAVVQVSALTIVEADTLEAAKAEAELRGATLSTTNWGDDPAMETDFVIEDADGEPTDIEFVGEVEGDD